MKLGLTLVLFLLSVSLVDADEVAKAKKYIPTLQNVIESNWYNMPYKEISCAQIETESNWNEKATLKTSREWGRGFSQITIAYSKDGKERFNNFKEAIKLKPLKDWNYKADPYNVKYQMTYLILTDKSNFGLMKKYICDDKEAFKASLVCYNAGYGRILQRRAVAKTKGTRTDIWTGGLDSACSSSEKSSVLYGKSLCSTVNAYPIKIIDRSKKYEVVINGTK